MCAADPAARARERPGPRGGPFLLFAGAAFAILLPVLAQAQDAARYSTQDVLRRYAQGRLLEERGELPEALEEYYRALSLDPQAVDIARRISEVAARLGDPGRSLEFADRALAIAPRDGRALWLRGAALLNLGRDAEAVEPLQAACAADSERVEYFRTFARAAERVERFDWMAAAYRKVVELEDGDGEAWFQLAAAEARLQRFDVADSALAIAVALNPLRPGVLFLRGWIAEMRGRTDAASRDYAEHLRIHVDDQGTRRRFVMVLAREKRFAEAAREAGRVAAARPEDLEAGFVEAEMYFEAGRRADAQRVLERIRKQHPVDLEAFAMRVAVLSRHGRAREAAFEAERRLESDPSNLRLRLLAARCREANREPDRAIRHLLDARQLAPDSLAPLVMLARSYDSTGRLAQAESTWVEAIGRFPTNLGLRYDLAVCREKRDDLGGAEEAIRDVLAREPENPTALNFLGYLFADHDRNLDEAVGLIERALAADPDNGAFLDSLGWAFYRQGRLADARRELEKAIQLMEGDPVIHEHLGDVYKDLRLNDLAKDQYRRSLGSDPTNRRVRDKLSRIR